MVDETKFYINNFFECNCENKYTIEPHGDGYVLYYGRCQHRHGYNLVYLKEPAFNIEMKHLETLINLGYQQYSDDLLTRSEK